jgi:hypothetical protein
VHTLLGTPTEAVFSDARKVFGGFYIYFGIANNIIVLLQQSPQEVVESLSLCMSADGVPLLKCISSQFWDLLNRILS